MANSGITKHQVKQAQAAIMARGQYPSIDAVRIELGNTGSKATIHRYLKELSDERVVLDKHQKPNISAALALLVEQLATQLREEADQALNEAVSRSQQKVHDAETRLAEASNVNRHQRAELEALRLQIESTEELSRKLLQELETLRIHSAQRDQQIINLEMLLVSKDQQIDSLEEKHQHAREALEHYRASVKEQREQDQRRHEHQVQQLQMEIRNLNQTIAVKQNEITHINSANVELTSDIKQLRSFKMEFAKKMATLEAKYSEIFNQYNQQSNCLLDITRERNSLVEENKEISKTLKNQEDALRILEMDKVRLVTEVEVKNKLLENLLAA